MKTLIIFISRGYHTWYPRGKIKSISKDKLKLTSDRYRSVRSPINLTRVTRFTVHPSTVSYVLTNVHNNCSIRINV